MAKQDEDELVDLLEDQSQFGFWLALKDDLASRPQPGQRYAPGQQIPPPPVRLLRALSKLTKTETLIRDLHPSFLGKLWPVHLGIGERSGPPLDPSLTATAYREVLGGVLSELRVHEGEAGRYSVPDTPQRWAKKYKRSTRTIVRWFDQQKIRNKKLSDRSYAVHLDDLPSGER